VFPVNFEGFRFVLNKPLSNHFQVSHTVNMGMMQSGYRFGATYIGKKMLSQSEVKTNPAFFQSINVQSENGIYFGLL
jgi:hypothetical protein